MNEPHIQKVFLFYFFTTHKMHLSALLSLFKHSNDRLPYPIYLKTENGTPFGWSLPTWVPAPTPEKDGYMLNLL